MLERVCFIICHLVFDRADCEVFIVVRAVY